MTTFPECILFLRKLEYPALHIWSESLDLSSQVTVIALVHVTTFLECILFLRKLEYPAKREFSSIEPSNSYCPCPRDHFPRMHSVFSERLEYPALHIWSESLDLSSQVTVIALVHVTTFPECILFLRRLEYPALHIWSESLALSSQVTVIALVHVTTFHMECDSVSQKTRVSSPSHMEREFSSIEPSNSYCPCPRDHLPRMHSVSQKTRVSSPSHLEREFISIEQSKSS